MSSEMVAVYDLARCPPTYDVIAFLSLLELERKRRGCSSVELHILPGPVGGFRADSLWPRSIEERVHMRDNVLIPICHLLPSVSSVGIKDRLSRRYYELDDWGFNKYLISLPNYVPALKQGSRPLRVRDEWALGPPDPKLITMTLREAEHWSQRNSRSEEWFKAGRVLRDRGYRVVIIRDTLKADHTVEGLEVDNLSATHINVRSAMYARALINIGINNGPMWMAVAMNAPVLMLRPVTDVAGGCFTTNFFRRYGVTPESDLPTAPLHQRLVWEEDIADNILKAFDEMLPCLI